MPVSVVPKRERVSVARPGVTRARLGRRGRRRRRLPAQTHSAPEGRPARADGRRDAVITLLKRPGAAPIPSAFRATYKIDLRRLAGVAAASQKPRLGLRPHTRARRTHASAHDRVRRAFREEARIRSTGDARRGRSRGRSPPVSRSQRAGLASSPRGSERALAYATRQKTPQCSEHSVS